MRREKEGMQLPLEWKFSTSLNCPLFDYFSLSLPLNLSLSLSLYFSPFLPHSLACFVAPQIVLFEASQVWLPYK